MGTRNEINSKRAYCEGQFNAAFLSCITSDVVSERQIDALKEYTSKARESIIEQSRLSDLEKDEMKRQWKQRLESYTNGVKDGLRSEGRLLL